VVLRCLLVTLVVLSLAGIRSVRGGDELAVVFVVDASDSISEAEQERARAFIEEALRAMSPGDQAALVLFGADALVERPMSGRDHLDEIASVPRTHQTDLEEAVRLAMALFPGGSARRMVLLTDGRATAGDAEAAVRLARAQGAQVDVVPLGTLPEAEAWLTDLRLPNQLHQGDSFTLSVVVESTAQTVADLVVLAGDRAVARQTVRLSPGRNQFAVPQTAGEPGFTTYRVLLAPAADTYVQNNGLSAFAMVEGPPRVLLVAPDAAEARPLREALRAAGLEVEERTAAAMPSEPAALAEYASLVLVDTPAQALAPRAMDAVQTYVRDLGGGLVAVGGPNAYGVGGWYDTPLEETLPVEMTIRDPERFPPMSIVVVIDKSGSMSAEENGVQKIRLAGEAAARVAELINPLDEITVIAFDDRPADVIGPYLGTERAAVIDQVIRLQAGGGGIYVRESLRAALDVLDEAPHRLRHIILLADGADSEHQEGVPGLVEEEIAGQNITLSTVAIGRGQDLGFLERIAGLGGGRYHITDRAATLPVIFAQETQLAMRSYVVEEAFHPRQASISPILGGIEAAPQLLGYVPTTPKPAARVVLVTHQDDPLLAAWQYGLGRAVAWTSDAAGRWAQQWVGWDAFPRFWSQAVRWTIARQSDVPVEVSVTLEGEAARIEMDAVADEGTFIDGLSAAASLVGPEGEATLVDLVQTAPGRYEGIFTPEAEGAYLLRVTGSAEGEDVLAMTTGWVLGYPPEYAALAADPDTLAYLAELGGGRVLEEPEAAFDHALQGEGTTRHLWPVLLAVAVVLLPFDVAARRLAIGRQDLARAWAWMQERLPRQRLRPAAEAPEPVRRLFQAKERVERARPVAAPPAREAAAEKRVAPKQASRKPPTEPAESPVEVPSPARPAEGETLASQLLKRKREREQ
jgi:uncharacterized membrane protein